MRSFAFPRAAVAALVLLGSGGALVGCAAFQPSEPEGPPPLDAVDTATTRTFLEVAEIREDEADWSGALARVDKALALQPNARTALLRRAQLALLVEQAGGAEADRDEVREILARAAAEAPDADLALAQAWLDTVEGRGDAARAGAQRASDAAPDSARAQWMAARLLALLGDPVQSLAAAERAVQLDARSGAAQRARARALLRSGDFENALAAIGPHLRAHPNDAEARSIEGEALWRTGNFSAARRSYESIPAAARDAGALAALGWIALRLDDREAARAVLEAGLAARPTDARLLDAALALDAREKRVGDSIARLDAAAAARPDDAAIARLRGRALAAGHHPDDAAAAFGRALALAPDDAASYDSIAAWLAHAKPEEVEPRLARVGAAGAPGLIAVGRVRAARGDRAGAVEALRKAVEVDPALPLARALLARALANAGQSLDQAVTLAREARAAAPSDPDVAWALGLAHLARGQNESAFEALREAAGTYPVERDGYGEIFLAAAQAIERTGERSLALSPAKIALAHAGDREPAPAWKASAQAMVARLAPAPPRRSETPSEAPATSETTPPATESPAPSASAESSPAASATPPAATTPATSPPAATPQAPPATPPAEATPESPEREATPEGAAREAAPAQPAAEATPAAP